LKSEYFARHKKWRPFMSKWLKIIFILSVVLNIALVIGAVWARSYIRKENFELAANIAEAEASFSEHILTELESGQPDRIEAVKKLLANGIENARKEADIMRNAAKR
jgi:hypothetical protein